ncbi:MAG: type V CRISPR-associated protein Cas12b [Nitrospira sp.]|nr:type V CRISPR-associated protein Cas12b [Nitrospira sp.]
MPQEAMPPVTKRAYTLRLRGADPSDTSWREALWKTHEAVNKGAKAFGDWLLTLRGGLDHTLVDTKVKDGKGKSDRDPTPEERKARRILLALSWLSVESRLGAPADFIVAYGTEAAEDRNSKVIAALEEILKSRGLEDTEIAEWKNDCSPSLSAAIRDDAVWVNRSKAFDEAVKGQNKQQGRQDAQTLLWYLLTENYLQLPSKAEKKQSEPLDQEEEEPDSEEISEAVGKSGKGAGQRTRHPFSHIFGKNDNQGFGRPVRQLELRNHWQKHLKPLVEGADIPLKNPNSRAKGETPSPTELHREMFSKAAARLAQIWTKQKKQEVVRELRTAADADLKKLENDQAYCKPLALLNAYCRERGQSVGSLGEYRINPRAVEGWERVVAAWEKIKQTDPAKAAEARIEEAKRLQDEDPDKKFGDINLFINLAEPEYEPVWRHNGQSTPSILKSYVKGWKARSDAVRLKVAAFRHPDPYFHPDFCQFGISRPPIKYNRLKINPRGDPREVQMRLWTGSQAKDITLLAVSNRFDKEIGTIDESTVNPSSNATVVTRRSRLGIASTARLGGSGVFRVAHVFDQQEVRSRKREDQVSSQDQTGGDNSQGGKQKEPTWNGTLQADRRELEAIGKIKDSQKAGKARKRLRWWLTVSLELQQKGPWYDFIGNSSDKTAFTRIYKSGKNKGTEYISQDGWPHERANDTRKGHARLILSRLPGLRVLSVDLGHRYAAACAVWEAVTSEQMKEACKAANHRAPQESDLYLHLKTKGHDGKERTTIYRRIGADTLPDGTEHPAPWARLDRQFLIKLQGEEEGTREASNEEIWRVHQLEAKLGRTVLLIDRLVGAGWGVTEKQKLRIEELKQLGWRPAKDDKPASDVSSEDMGSDGYRLSLAVDELMFSTVRILRLGLKRHGDRARIAHYLITNEKTKPGGIKEQLDENGRLELLQDALALWHDLFSSRGWRDDAARQLWDEHIAKLSGYNAPEEIGEESSGSERKKKQRENRKKLHEAVMVLAQDATLRQKLHDEWKKRWEDDDKEWKQRLRWFKDWVFPRGKAADDPVIRKVGGLSLTRLATLTEFRRKVQLGFFTRLHPDGTRAETKEQFGQSVLDALEHLREQRVKQIASRIVEAALGVGSENPRHWDKGKRPRQRIDDPRFAPCHAIIIEDLTHYRPEETRTRRENRQLMIWSSSKIKKYLAEACQLHGLHLREVQAAYTSRQDSRTGAPGIRCQDVPVKEFMQSPFWRKQVKQAEAKQAENKGDARDRFLCDLNAMWKDKTVADWEKAGVIRVPLNGGEVFVSADPVSPAAKGLQADLNAAANIGLQALTDPDWPGKWWYVPCNPASFRPIKDKVGGSAVVKPDQALRQSAQTQSGDAKDKKKRGKRGDGKPKEVVNLWSDLDTKPLENRNWEEYAAYQHGVLSRVVHVLKKQLKDRHDRRHDEPRADDIPL